jgi:7-carboxy-7-deazaguanine synthase
MNYPLAERFKSLQGEGLYTGTPMAFIRFVGCSVGQKVCTACDTDFTSMRKDLGGGSYTAQELLDWIGPDYDRVCMTGGEPMDRDLGDLILFLRQHGKKTHMETSGTKIRRMTVDGPPFGLARPDWITVSPKPGYHESMISLASEIKVILHGLGDGPGWPTLQNALDWANGGKLVYLQPRNERLTVDTDRLHEVVSLCKLYPQLRCSLQLHKVLGER